MGLPSKCTVCTGDHEETTQHCFQTCTGVQKAWDLFKNLRQKANLTQEPENWEETLMGKALATTGQCHEVELPWGADKAYTINSNSPWDMLRTNLLWYIWVQKCNHNFREEKFNLTSALYRAWQTTIQIGMAAWYEIQKFRGRRNQQRQLQLEEACIRIWTKGNIFANESQGNIQWKHTPDSTFLKRELAEEFLGTRNQRRDRQPSQSSNSSLANQRDTASSQHTQPGSLGPMAPPTTTSGPANGSTSATSPRTSESGREPEEDEEERHRADIQALLALSEIC